MYLSTLSTHSEAIYNSLLTFTSSLYNASRSFKEIAASNDAKAEDLTNVKDVYEYIYLGG